MTLDEARTQARQAVGGDGTQSVIDRLAERIGARSGAEAVFGEPITSGEVIVVPVARVRWGVGGGGGASQAEGASGSGGGGGMAGDPVGYLEITPAGARFVAISQPWASAGYVLAATIGGAIVLRALARLLR